MRLLITSIASTDWLCRALLAGDNPPEIAAFHASCIDIIDQGLSRPDTSTTKPYLLRTSPVFPTRPYTASLYRGGLLPLLREFRPDVIYHYGEPSELGSWQVLRLAARVCPKTPVVLFSLENVIRDFRGFPHCLRQWAMNATLPRVDYVAAASLSVKRCWEKLGFPADRVRVVYIPIDQSRFYRREAAALRARWARPEQFVVGYIGRLVHEKGADVLLRAIARLPERYVLVVEGQGLREAALHDLADELQLGDRVRWLGRIPSDQVPEAMSAFDAFVVPSRSIPVWQEQFGRVLPEAMACGTPVVGSSCGAIPDVIGEAGLVFPEEDDAALAERLLQLGEDPSLRKELVRRGLQRVQEEFTFEVMVRRLRALFEQARTSPKR